jgi:uncharacterized lipoprotein YmbA
MWRRLGWLGVSLSSVACLGGAPSQTFVLSVPTTVPMLTVNQAPGTALEEIPALRVEMVLLPAYLDNTEILLRLGPHRLESAPGAHWGERLSLGLTHALAADLNGKLNRYRIILQGPQSPTARLLGVEVDSFDLFPDGHCVLAASWAIVEKSGATAPILGRGTYVTPPLAVLHPDNAALVGAMSAAVAELAEGVGNDILHGGTSAR